MPFKPVSFVECDVVLSSVLLLCDKDKFKFLSVPRKRQLQKLSVCHYLAQTYAKATEEEYDKMKNSSKQQKGPFYLFEQHKQHLLVFLFV